MTKYSRLRTWKLIVLLMTLFVTMNAETHDVHNALATQDNRQTTDQNIVDDDHITTSSVDFIKPRSDSEVVTVLAGLDNKHTTDDGVLTTTSNEGLNIKMTTYSAYIDTKMTTFEDILNMKGSAKDIMTTTTGDINNEMTTIENSVEDMVITTIKDNVESTRIYSSENTNNGTTAQLEDQVNSLTTTQRNVKDTNSFEMLEILGTDKSLILGWSKVSIVCLMHISSNDMIVNSLSLYQKQSEYLMGEIVSVKIMNKTSEIRWSAKEMDARKGVNATADCSNKYCQLELHIDTLYTRCEDAKEYQCMLSALTPAGPMTAVSSLESLRLSPAVEPSYTDGIQGDKSEDMVGQQQEYMVNRRKMFTCTGSIGSDRLKHKWHVAFADDPCSDCLIKETFDSQVKVTQTWPSRRQCSDEKILTFTYLTAAEISFRRDYYFGNDGCNRKGLSKVEFLIPDVTRPIVVWCWISYAKTVEEECNKLTENNLMKSLTIFPVKEEKPETRCKKSDEGTYVLKPEQTTYQQNEKLSLVCRYNRTEPHRWFFRRITTDAWHLRDHDEIEENDDWRRITMIIPKLALIDRGWYACVWKDFCYEQRNSLSENQTVFVDVLHEPCRENGILIAGDACVEITSASSCASNKGTIASIHTKEKYQILHGFAFHVHLIERYLNIGLNLTANAMQWKNFVWADGSPLTFIEKLNTAECPICKDNYPVSLAMLYISTFADKISWALSETQDRNVLCEWQVERTQSTGLSLPLSTSKYSGSKALFTCTTGEYISSVNVCDGTPDCNDISDETNCDKGCVGATFQCEYGGCISVSKSCDFIRDCADGSDEEKCNYPPCGEGFWQCANKECIPVYDVCDGDVECIDGSDEADALCTANSVLPTGYTFRCFNPDRILPLARKCDGIRDCQEINDEDCSLTYFSCSAWAADNTTDINLAYIAVDYGMPQYGTLTVQCTTDDKEVHTKWVFSQEQDITTPYEAQFSSQALWFEAKWNKWEFQSISYQSHYQQKVMLDSSSACVQYIRPCAYFVFVSGLIIEWTSSNGDLHNMYVEDYYGCSGYCRQYTCEVALNYHMLPEDQYYDGNADFGWIPVTNKSQLPVTTVRSNFVSVIGVSHLICSEDLHQNDFNSKRGLCKSGNNYDDSLNCLMDFDLTGEPIACRDLTHLENCENFTCPKDYAKCPGSFCLHMRFVCDGTAHCPHREDELDCDSTNCSSHYKCRGGRSCISVKYVCDGVRHCPLGDDEKYCDVTCPTGCTCQGLTFECDSGKDVVYSRNISSKARWISIKADLKNTTNHFPLSLPFLTALILQSCFLEELTVHGQSLFKNIPALRHLDLSFNQIQTLPEGLFNDVPVLKTLVLSHNPIASVPGNIFQGLKTLKYLHISHTKIKELNIKSNIFAGLSSLEYLDLSANTISTLPNNLFSNLATLHTLILTDNPIVSIEVQAFAKLFSLSSLQLSNINSQRILSGVFNGLQSLTTLNLSSSGIDNLGFKSFNHLSNLEYLDIQKNNIEVEEFMFEGLETLQYLYADTYKMCCIKPKSVLDENCFAPADLISSCSNLIGSEFLRVCLWIICSSALVGNIFVMIYRLVIDKRNVKKSQSIFVINLSISDLIMGIYMIIIAAVDTHFSGNYVVHDTNWRQGTLCVTAGCLSVISSEMSTFAIFLITIDRFIAIVFPLSLRKITWRTAVVFCAMFWIVSVILAIVPNTTFPGYFKGEFYSRSGVCLALPLTGGHVSGQEYSVAVFIGLNGLLFLLILIAQMCIHRHCKGKVGITTTEHRKREIAVARSLFLVVATDFLCWFPVGVIGMWSLLGGAVSADVYAWVMVFVLPINSAINPFLYTYVYIKRRQKINAALKQPKNVPEKVKGKLIETDGLNPSDNLKMIYFSNLYKLRLDFVPLEKYSLDGKLSPTQAYQIARRVMEAVSFLHQRDIIHGNVSDRNVCINNTLQCFTRACLLLDRSPIGGDKDSHTDILQYGLLVKKLLRMLNKY